MTTQHRETGARVSDRIPMGQADTAAHRLTPLLDPRSIALIGASENGPASYLSNNLRDFGFDPERIFYVNPRRSSVHGAPTFPRIASVPIPVDLAVILVPSSSVVGVLSECAEAGVKAVLVYPGGFKEIGRSDEQDEMVAIAARSDMRLLGPNCLGFLNATGRVAAATFAPSTLPRDLSSGGIALVSQSGGILISAIELGTRLGLGFSLLASTGNQAGVTILDVADYLVDDPATRVIGLIVEDLRDGRFLLEIARRARRVGKPIVALKLGRSAAGREAALSHTASLMGSAEVFDAAARQSGIALVSTISELVDRLAAFSKMRPRVQDGLAFLTISGGAKVLVADLAEQYGLRLASLSEETRRSLGELLPEGAVAGNPLDLTTPGIASEDVVRGSFRALAADPDVGSLALVMHLKSGGNSDLHRRLIRDFCEESASTEKQTAVISTIPEGISGYWRDVAAASPVPFLNDLASFASLRAMIEYSAARDEPGSDEGSVPLDPPAWIEAIRAEDRVALTEPETYNVLEDVGIRAAPWRLTTSAAEASVAARELGFPVVVKAVSPQLSHKSRIGGVRLDLRSSDDVRAACASIAESVQASGLDVAITGYLVQQMVAERALELLVGTFDTPDFGPCVTVGLGGVAVEVLNQRVTRVCPVSEQQASRMLDELHVSRLLGVDAGSGPAGLQDAARAIAALSRLAASSQAWLREIEINPLLVQQHQAIAVDALAGLRSSN